MRHAQWVPRGQRKAQTGAIGQRPTDGFGNQPAVKACQTGELSIPPTWISGAIHIDGSVLEGGGQILRNSFSYAATLRKAVVVKNIRSGRPIPGLRAQHLESLKLIARLSADGDGFWGGSLGSTEVALQPNYSRSGEFDVICETAGAVSLMVQAALIPLAFAADGNTTLRLVGGTDVRFAPPIDFMKELVAPTMKQIGIQFDSKTVRRGFFPAGGGKVVLSVEGLPRGSSLQPLSAMTKGKLQAIRGRLFSAYIPARNLEHFASALREELASWTTCREANPTISIVTEEPAGGRRTRDAFAVELVAETDDGRRFFGSSIGDGRQAIQDCVADLVRNFGSSHNCVDPHLMDQLILPLSLASGVSELQCSELSRHTQTCIFIARLFTSAKIEILEIQADQSLQLIPSECLAPDCPNPQPLSTKLENVVVRIEGIDYKAN